MHELLLRRALASFLGQELTPEVAAQIYARVMDDADRAVDPARFAPQVHGGYVYAVERFRQVLEELHPLHVAHWRETEKHRHGLPLDPDYRQMALRERLGELMQFTVRRDARLCGHLRVYLGRSLHSGTVFAEEDTLYVAPEHRGGWVGMHLLRYAQQCLQALGVRELRADSKLVNKADVLMRRLGYQAVATKFVKVL